MAMIVQVTDFGPGGPYIGQMRAVLHAAAPEVPVVDLFTDLAPFDPRAAAYLLPAYCAWPFPAEAVFLCVIDPGVGTERAPLVIEADGRRFVGPDNGLFEMVLRRATTARAWTIVWRPEHLSATFHGRDLFAPTAAALASGAMPPAPGLRPTPLDDVMRPDWPDDLPEVVYIDPYGNALTGLRGTRLTADTVLEVAGRRLRRAATFGAAEPGAALWHVNSNGLAEVSVNGGRADQVLGLRVGTPLVLHERE
jgi:S-adenosylmethionine hydrolase